MHFPGAHAEDQLLSIHMTFITLLTHLTKVRHLRRLEFGKLVWCLRLWCLFVEALHGSTVLTPEKMEVRGVW